MITTRKKKKSKQLSAVRHANRYDSLTWCTAREDWSQIMNDGIDVVGEIAPPEDLDEVTCGDCLRRIAAYGEMAARRLREIA